VLSFEKCNVEYMVNFNLTCFTCSQTLEEHILNSLENGVLRTVFGPKSKEETGVKKNLFNGDPYNLYS
jgi:hypothetical protein